MGLQIPDPRFESGRRLPSRARCARLPTALAPLLLLALFGCARRPAEPRPPVTEEGQREAADVVLALAADPASKLALFEGGLTADAYRWTTEERVVWDELPHGGITPDVPRGPRVVKERRLRGPERISFRFSDLVAAEPHAMLLETDVEIRVRGEPDPFLLDVGGDAAARRLAEALDVLIRAREASR